MGNSGKKPADYSVVNTYIPAEWIRLEQKGQYEIWQNQRTSQRAQAYPFNKKLVTEDLDKFQLRKNNVEDIVSVYNIAQDENKNLCSKSDKAHVLVQNIPLRLSDVNNLTEDQSLLVLRSAYRGFNTLGTFYGPIEPYEDMICFNERGVPKVWLNSNLSLNHPEADRQANPLKNTNNNNRNQVYVRKIFDMVENRSSSRQLPIDLKNKFRSSNYHTFFEALNGIEEYAFERKINLPSAIHFNNSQFPHSSSVTHFQNRNTSVDPTDYQRLKLNSTVWKPEQKVFPQIESRQIIRQNQRVVETRPQIRQYRAQRIVRNPVNFNNGAPQNMIQMKSTGNLFVPSPVQTHSNTQSHVLHANTSSSHTQFSQNQPIRTIQKPQFPVSHFRIPTRIDHPKIMTPQPKFAQAREYRQEVSPLPRQPQIIYPPTISQVNSFQPNAHIGYHQTPTKPITVPVRPVFSFSQGRFPVRNQANLIRQQQRFHSPSKVVFNQPISQQSNKGSGSISLRSSQRGQISQRNNNEVINQTNIIIVPNNSIGLAQPAVPQPIITSQIRKEELENQNKLQSLERLKGDNQQSNDDHSREEVQNSDDRSSVEEQRQQNYVNYEEMGYQDKQENQQNFENEGQEQEEVQKIFYIQERDRLEIGRQEQMNEANGIYLDEEGREEIFKGENEYQDDFEDRFENAMKRDQFKGSLGQYSSRNQDTRNEVQTSYGIQQNIYQPIQQPKQIQSDQQKQPQVVNEAEQQSNVYVSNGGISSLDYNKSEEFNAEAVEPQHETPQAYEYQRKQRVEESIQQGIPENATTQQIQEYIRKKYQTLISNPAPTTNYYSSSNQYSYRNYATGVYSKKYSQNSEEPKEQRYPESNSSSNRDYQQNYTSSNDYRGYSFRPSPSIHNPLVTRQQSSNSDRYDAQEPIKNTKLKNVQSKEEIIDASEDYDVRKMASYVESKYDQYKDDRGQSIGDEERVSDMLDVKSMERSLDKRYKSKSNIKSNSYEDEKEANEAFDVKKLEEDLIKFEESRVGTTNNNKQNKFAISDVSKVGSYDGYLKHERNSSMKRDISIREENSYSYILDNGRKNEDSWRKEVDTYQYKPKTKKASKYDSIDEKYAKYVLNPDTETNKDTSRLKKFINDFNSNSNQYIDSKLQVNSSNTLNNNSSRMATGKFYDNQFDNKYSSRQGASKNQGLTYGDLRKFLWE